MEDIEIASPTEVNKTVTINAPASKIWDALVNPDMLKIWMAATEIEVATTWEIGSPIVIRGKINGKYESKGTVLEFEPEKVLKYNSWNKISKLKDKVENYTIVEFKLTSVEFDRTILTVTHSNLIAEAAYEHSNFYWTSALYLIKQILEQGVK